jgi:hypothetical protein
MIPHAAQTRTASKLDQALAIALVTLVSMAMVLIANLNSFA